MEIRISLPEGKTPVLRQYDGQCQPQPAYLQLDQDGFVSADYSGEIGNAMPVNVWHSIDRRIGINTNVSGDALREYMASAGFRALIDRYYAGFDTEWNGNNWVGTVTEDALEALSQIEQDLENLECINVFSADDWVEYATRSELEQHGDAVSYAKHLYSLCDMDQDVEGGVSAIEDALNEKFGEEDE